jgi:hypothetical protein
MPGFKSIYVHINTIAAVSLITSNPNNGGHKNKRYQIHFLTATAQEDFMVYSRCESFKS